MEVGGYGDSGDPNNHEPIVQPSKLSLSKPALVKAACAPEGEKAIHRLASTRNDRFCLPSFIGWVKKHIRYAW
jgi:hypothetical protein